jgi:hypothetical protein
MINKIIFKLGKYGIINIYNIDDYYTYTGPDGKDYLEINIQKGEENSGQIFDYLFKVGKWVVGKVI